MPRVSTIRSANGAQAARRTYGSGASPSGFRLVPWFALLSLVSIATVSAMSAFVLSQFISERLIYREAEVMTDFVNGIIEVERADKTSSLYSAWIEGDVEEFFYHLGSMPDILRANVYRPNGEIVWSSDPVIAGQRFERNDELDAAFGGRPVINHARIGEENKDEHAYLRLAPGDRFIESYLPIWQDPGLRREVVGVVEVYRAPNRLFETIDDGIRRVWVSALAGGAFIFVTLFWVVRRAARIIERQGRELAASNTLAAVGEMASAVAHSLRNPLSSIRSSAELAIATGASGNVKMALKDILSDSDRLEVWIRQYLASTQADIHSDGVADVSEAIRETIDNMSDAFRSNGIRASVEIEPDLPAVRPSTLLLIQVLNGLVANAIDTMPNGGSLDVKAVSDHDGDLVRILIEDTGAGLCPQEMRAAFEPFSTTKGTGFGLGLPLARRVVSRYGGQLTLSNRREGGATATLLLPAAS